MEIKVELNIPADLEIELSSTFLVEPSRQFGVEHSYTEFLELSNCSRILGGQKIRWQTKYAELIFECRSK